MVQEPMVQGSKRSSGLATGKLGPQNVQPKRFRFEEPSMKDSKTFKEYMEYRNYLQFKQHAENAEVEQLTTVRFYE